MRKARSVKRRSLWLVPLAAVVVLAASVVPVSTGASDHHAAQPKVYFLNLLATDPFWQAATRGAQTAATALGADFVTLDGNLNATTQAGQFATATTAGAGVILIAAVDSKAVIPQLVAARKAGIAVCSVNLTEPGTMIDGTVAMREVAGAQTAARDILANAKKQGKKALTVVNLVSVLTNENSRLRLQGFTSVMKNPNVFGIKVRRIDKQTNGTLDGAASALSAVAVQAHIDAIYTQTDYFTPALVPVLTRNHYTKASGKNHAYFVGTGGLPDGLKAIRQGWQDVTYSFPIDQQANACLRFGVAVKNGQSVKAVFASVVKASGMDTKTTVLGGTAATGPQILQLAKRVTRANVNDKSLWGNQ